jgi:cation:H+ antiporter
MWIRFGAVGALPVWTVPALVFSAALFVTLRAAAWFTRWLEDLGDLLNFTPGLLSFVSALGANIPNYAASLVAFASGQAAVGLGVIVGSNIYNVAIILGLVTFVAPGGRGIALAPPEMRDARRVAWLAAGMGVSTWLSVRLFTAADPWPLSLLPQVIPGAALMSLLTIGLFVGLLLHALQRDLKTLPQSIASEEAPPMSTRGALPPSSSRLLPSPAAIIVGCGFALGLALAGVIVMVQAGQVVGEEMRLPPAVLGLLVLAVATSLPNTVVAYQLARTARAEACVEEILSSNGVNLALGAALPALVWGIRVVDPAFLSIDLPLLFGLGFVAVMLLYVRRIPRLVGVGLIGLYVLWIMTYLLQ